MANEIVVPHPTGATLYAVAFTADGRALAGTAPEAPVAASWAAYAVPLVEAPATGIYRGDFPAVAAGTYSVAAYRQAGGAPAATDPAVATGPIEWDGAAVAPLSALRDRLPAALVGGRMPTILEAYAPGLGPDALLDGRLDAVDAAVAAVAGYLDAEIAAIKAKTDLLPADPASNTQVATRSSHAAADVAAAVGAIVIEGSTTLIMSIRGSNAALMGKSSGLDSGSPAYRDLADTKARITAASDEFGNRSSVTRDLT